MSVRQVYLEVFLKMLPDNMAKAPGTVIRAIAEAQAAALTAALQEHDREAATKAVDTFRAAVPITPCGQEHDNAQNADKAPYPRSILG